VTDYVKIPELARRLSVSEKTARRYVKKGVLPSRFIGGAYRVTEEDLVRYIENARVAPGKALALHSQRTLFNGVDEERRTASFDRARQNLEELVEPFEAKVRAGTFTDEDHAALRRTAALITPWLQVALEAEASFLREQYPDEYDVGPYAVLGPAIARFVQLVYDASEEPGQELRDLDEIRKAAYRPAA
jgi:excisionase family DNA binding protein